MFTALSFNVQSKESDRTHNLLIVGLTAENLAKIRNGNPAFLLEPTHATPPGCDVILCRRVDAKKLILASEGAKLPEGDAETKPLVGSARTPRGMLWLIGLPDDQLAALAQKGAVVYKDDHRCSPPGWDAFITCINSEMEMRAALEREGLIDANTQCKIDPRHFTS